MKALPKGAHVKHFQYGFGIVTESDAEYTKIDFDLYGMKRFLTTIMVVEQSEEPPAQPVLRRKKAR